MDRGVRFLEVFEAREVFGLGPGRCQLPEFVLIEPFLGYRNLRAGQNVLQQVQVAVHLVEDVDLLQHRRAVGQNNLLGNASGLLEAGDDAGEECVRGGVDSTATRDVPVVDPEPAGEEREALVAIADLCLFDVQVSHPGLDDHLSAPLPVESDAMEASVLGSVACAAVWHRRWLTVVEGGSLTPGT